MRIKKMPKQPLPKEKNIYETECPILYAMEIIGQKWKLPILWYIADTEKKLYVTANSKEKS